MLFTVFVERLLLSAPLGTIDANNYAVAIQFLDYPLVVVRPSPSADAAGTDVQQDIVLFKRGTAAVLDADENELSFLVSNVSFQARFVCSSATLLPDSMFCNCPCTA